MENLFDTKLKRKQEEDSLPQINETKTNKVDPSASLLVKAIKSKTEVLKRKKEQVDQKRKMFKNK